MTAAQTATGTAATWYAAQDTSSPAELAAVYGPPQVHWMPANTGHYHRMVTGAGGPGRAPVRFAWATYLENAYIREITQGEG